MIAWTSTIRDFARNAIVTARTFQSGLEHGLSEAELVYLKEEVRNAVERGRRPRKTWLPSVVYAAEIGYEYTGDEYWQTFEAETPSWDVHGDRNYIRHHFRQFAEKFGGATPSGPWARQFSIRLPADHARRPPNGLQRNLARLLFEYRAALTTTLLRDPAELGRRLAARAFNSSSRFQGFAQSTDLLEQVAAALLGGEDERSAYLLESTLHRIMSDLTAEREARRWLVTAKFIDRSTAAEACNSNWVARRCVLFARAGIAFRLRAIRNLSSEWGMPDGPPDPSIFLTCCLCRSDSSTTTQDELGSLRAQVAGVERPLARGRLLSIGQPIRLDRWPSNGITVHPSKTISRNKRTPRGSVPPPSRATLAFQGSSRRDGTGRTWDVCPTRQVDRAVSSYVPSTAARPEWIRTVPCATVGVVASQSTPEVLGFGGAAGIAQSGHRGCPPRSMSGRQASFPPCGTAKGRPSGMLGRILSSRYRPSVPWIEDSSRSTASRPSYTGRRVSKRSS